LHDAHAIDSGGYLQDIGRTGDLPDFADLGVELTREFRGLRLWLPLHLHGTRAFTQALDEKLDLAAAAHRELRADPRLDVPWDPDLTVIVFRPRAGDDAARRLLDAVNATGRAYLSSTMI